MFNSIKKKLKDKQNIDVDNMEFKIFGGVSNSYIQDFVNISLPNCPICKSSHNWKCHEAHIDTSMYPVRQTDHYYHFRCENCGGIIHIKHHSFGEDLVAPFLYNPNPNDNLTMVVIDKINQHGNSKFTIGAEYSIFSLNDK